MLREAVARARNQVALAAVMQRARAALERQDWTGAIRATTEAELYQPGLDEARQIRHRAQTAIDEQAARERARQERIRDAVEGARRAIVHGALEEAQAHADQAARDRADPRVLENLRTEIELARQQAESAARRSAQAAALIGEAIAKFNAGEFRAAIVRCDAALRIQPDEPQALDVRRRAQRAIEEEEEKQRQAAEAERQRLAAEAERRRLEAEAARRRQAEEDARLAREQHERAAQAEIEAARRDVDAGRFDSAIARLERFAPPHDDVARALAAVRAEAAERRAQAEAAARAEREEAARRLAEEQRQREEDARRAEEEQRAARAARAAALAETSRELASAGQYPQALATLAEATRLDPANPALQELTRQIRDAKTAHEAAERRARDLAAKLAEAESRLAAGDFAKARKSTEAAAQIDAQAPGVQAMLARIAEAEARVAQEKAEQQKAAEAARQARERDQKVGALITKARKAKRPADALGFLEEAQRLDPQRPELAALIAQRQAEIARAAAPPPERPADRVAEPGVPERKAGRPLSPAMLGGAAAAVLLLVVGLWYVLHEPTPKPNPDPDPPVVVDPRPADPGQAAGRRAVGGHHRHRAVDPRHADAGCRRRSRDLHDAVPAAAAARRVSAGVRERRAVAAVQRTPLGAGRPAGRRAAEDAGLRRRSRRRRHRRPLTSHAAAASCSQQARADVSSVGALGPYTGRHSSGPMSLDRWTLGGRMLRGRSLGQAIGVVALVCATFGVSTASAQVDYEIMASLQFNFSNPGARSLAMAGALTGAGDDATGAWTNPGGLTNITRPEVGVEFRGFDFETPFVSAGHFHGSRRTSASTPSPGRVYGNSEDSTHSLSFVSAVVPKSRFAFAFYRTEVANYETNISTDGTFFDDPVRRHPVARRSPDERHARAADRELRRLGGRPADRPVLGRRRRLVLRLRARLRARTATRGLRPGPDPGQLRRPAARDARATSYRHRIHRRRGLGAFGVNIGASINPSDTFRIGASYRQGPKFDMPTVATDSFGDADHRRRPASSRCPTCLASACSSSRSRS